MVMVLVLLSVTGCNDKDKDKDDDIKENPLTDKLTMEFDVTDKENYKDSVAMLVEDEPVYVDEVMWYIFLVEDSMKIYSETYENGTKESYWEQVMESGETLGEQYTKDIKNQIIYNQVLSSKAISQGLECNKEEIVAQAKEIFGNISPEDKEKYGLTEDAYIRMLEKWELVDKYLEFLGTQVEIDEEELRKKKPIESFQCKINTEFIIVLNTYVDDNGEKQVHDDSTITELIKELDNARKDVIAGKSMKEVAEDYDNVDYYESSFYKGTSSAVEAYEETAAKLKPGEVSEVVRDALSSYVIKRLDDTKEADYAEYIESLVGEKQDLYAQEKGKEYTDNANVRMNEAVWKTIGIGKNNS